MPAQVDPNAVRAAIDQAAYVRHRQLVASYGRTLFGTPRLTLTIRRVVLKSIALVECGITAQTEGKLSLSGTIATQTIAIKNGGQHLNIVVEPPTSTTEDVELNYCEIAALK
jgi:hypothetical protein